MMKIKIELEEHEVKAAIAKAIEQKFPNLKFYNEQIKMEASVKIKRKAVRKEIVRTKASLEIYT